MGKDFKQIAQDVLTGVGAIGQANPETMKAFGHLSTAATAAGVPLIPRQKN